METEIEWYETKYKDKTGRFYINKKGQLQKRFKIREPKILEGNIGGTGYLYVSVCENRKHIKKTIHSIMGEVFLENTHNYRNIDHINRNKTDNRLENLRWLSQSYNMLNTNEIKNISWNEEKQRWLCKIKDEVIGRFYTKEEAIACKYGYLKGLNILTKANDTPTNLPSILD
jgi:hypothetical protein